MKPNHLHKLRIKIGLSVYEAAESVHVTTRSWYRYEDGTRQIPEAIVHLFCSLNNIKYPC